MKKDKHKGRKLSILYSNVSFENNINRRYGTKSGKTVCVKRRWIRFLEKSNVTILCEKENNTRNKHNTTALIIPIKIAGTILEFFL